MIGGLIIWMNDEEFEEVLAFVGPNSCVNCRFSVTEARTVGPGISQHPVRTDVKLLLCISTY